MQEFGLKVVAGMLI